MKMKTTLLAVCGGFGFIAGSASAATLIGAGAGAGGTSADGAGGRTNIDQAFVNLAAGTYNVDDFNFWGVSPSGTVQPFLATQTTGGPGQRYTPIWTGSAGGAILGTNTVSYTSGTQQFTLAAATNVYSGFAMTGTAVGFAGGGTTDHNGAALVPTIGVELSVFSNNNLGRTYSSGINVSDASLVPVTGGLVGPGSGITNALQQDTPGAERLNVDRTSTLFAAGSYNVSDWSLNVFDNTEGGTITPMLLTGSSGSYTTLWLGSAFDPSSDGVQTVPESGSFTLGSATEVYAGIFTQGQGSGIIALDQNNVGSGSSVTDHDSAFSAPTGVGQSVAGFSNLGLGRTYAFGINVVPEPSVFGLLALSGLGLIVRRRR